MRSRFTAYVLGEVDYLVATTHPSYRRADLKAGYQVSHDSVRWMGLRILATSQGQESDKTGKVEFEATYLQDGQRSVHCEKSRFKRYAGNWYYVDGVVNDRHPG